MLINLTIWLDVCFFISTVVFLTNLFLFHVKTGVIPIGINRAKEVRVDDGTTQNSLTDKQNKLMNQEERGIRQETLARFYLETIG